MVTPVSLLPRPLLLQRQQFAQLGLAQTFLHPAYVMRYRFYFIFFDRTHYPVASYCDYLRYGRAFQYRRYYVVHFWHC